MKRKHAVIGIIAVVALGGLAWAFFPGEDPQVAKVIEMQNKLFTGDMRPPDAERRKQWEELRAESEKLTEEQRMKILRNNPPPFMKQIQEHVVSYFDLPQDQRNAALDKAIDEMERRRRGWEKNRANRKADGKDRPGGGPRGGFGGGGNDPARRQQFAKKMLDNTTPQQRAMFGEYFQDMQRRRQERGLPPIGRR